MVGKALKQYVVEGVLGKGGMGTVYRARDTRLQRAVALKVLTTDLSADPARKQRFFQEARAAASLSHPAIAQVFDIDEVDGITFIAMPPFVTTCRQTSFGSCCSSRECYMSGRTPSRIG